MKESYVSVGEHNLKLTNLNKLIWPEGLTKAHLVKYYTDIAPFILPHLRDRPLVMKRYPDGIEGEAFYQKECPEYAPSWIKRHPVEHSEKVVNYIICNDQPTLLWLANQGCIEIHAWLARVESLETPDLAVMDLDPAGEASFADVLEIALLVKRVLDEFKIKSYPKTSGSRGLHLLVPVKQVYSWRQVTGAMKYIAELVVKVHPDKTTVERKVEKRGAKVYLDYLQNGRGKTMAFQYGLRPLPGAPVSAPLLWEEVAAGKIRPGHFTMNTIFERIKSMGDIYASVLNNRQSLDELIKYN